MNKRGQEIAWGTIIIGLIIIVVAVLIILFVSGYFDRFGAVGEAIPEGLAAAAQGCRLAVQGGSVTSFCYEFKEVSDDEFVNCADSRILDELNKEGVQPLTCDPVIVTSSSIAECKKITNPNDWDNTKVNGQVCNDYTCKELGGVVPAQKSSGSSLACETGKAKVTLTEGTCCI